MIPPPPRHRFYLIQAVTSSRVILAGSFATVYLLMDPGTVRLTIALVLLALGEVTDLLDGMLARRWRQVSRWGQMFDPYADSVSRIIVYWALACSGTCLTLVPLVLALRDITVVYARVVLAQHGRSVAAAWAGKVKAVAQACGSFLLVLGPLHWERTGTWTIHLWSWLVMVLTAFSVVPYVSRAIMAAREGTTDGTA
jgi:CDP-diacylglycerol--glycerol-3-phosphate 3-phosphatidyltransferase